MEPQVHFITLGVADLEGARRFYVDGLGWKPVFEVPGAITFIQVGHGLLLGLFGADALDADVGQPVDRVAQPSPFSLAQVVDTEDQVMATLAAAETAGATILKPGQWADFGGFHGYFADPSGFRWEIATNPGWSVGPDGKVALGPI
jgi:catechol 2,3-dioxygenase-like lactoylglutathione lyase family enzyme